MCNAFCVGEKLLEVIVVMKRYLERMEVVFSIIIVGCLRSFGRQHL